MRTALRLAFIILCLVIAGLMAAAAAVGAPPPSDRTGIDRPRTARPAPALRADKIMVLKGARKLHLLRAGVIVRTYRIALGFAPKGHKQRKGDGRTPEGRYRISWRNPNSRFHRSLKISYPAAADRARARARGVSPGGDIFIHGLPKGRAALGAVHWRRDWTLGCIAVTNAEIEEIWVAVPDGTPIEIHP